MGTLLVMEGSGFLTSEMLTPITANLNADLGILLPVGISIMAIMIGVKLIPRIVYTFL